MSDAEDRKSRPPHHLSHEDGTKGAGFQHRDLAILSACRTPAGLDPLASQTGISRSSVHRRVLKLEERGLLSRQGNTYLLADAGRKALAGSNHPEETPTELSRMWPFLAVFPTPVHRAMAELILFARIARRDNLTDDRHPGFILLGPTQRLKSWLIKGLSFLTESTPDRCRVPMTQIRGRGLLARLNAKGEKIYECKALAEPLLWGEELSLADPAVKRDVETLLHGPKEVSVENEVVRVDAVPVFELNPKKKQGTLEERVGLDVPRIRRAIVCDFTGVKVTSRDKSESQDRLSRIQELSPASLPEGRKIVAPECQKLTDEAFARCIRPEYLDYVDPGRILNLVAGACALLPASEATRRVLWDFFTVAETTDFVVPDWHQRMAHLTVAVPEAEPFPPDVAKEPSYAPLLGGSEFNPFDLDQTLLRVKALVEKAGYHLPEDERKLEEFLGISRWMEKEGVEPEDFSGIACKVGRYLDLEAAIEELGSTEERIKQLHALGLNLAERGVELQAVERFVEFHLQLQKDGFDAPCARLLASALSEARKRGGNAAKGVKHLLEQARQNISLRGEIDRLTQRVGQLEEKKAALSTQVDETRKALGAYNRSLEKLKATWNRMVADLQARRTQKDLLEQEIRAITTGKVKYSASSSSKPHHKTPGIVPGGVGAGGGR